MEGFAAPYHGQASSLQHRGGNDEACPYHAAFDQFWDQIYANPCVPHVPLGDPRRAARHRDKTGAPMVHTEKATFPYGFSMIPT